MAVACGAFIVKGYPRLPNSYLAQYHQVTGTMAMLFAWWTFYKAATVPAGKITANTLGKFSCYAYDDVMYSAENVCKTCGFEKPARSKHCKVMKACVPKYDHYCIWLNQAVGAGNYRWFLLFLLSHVGLLVYGTVASAGVIAGVIDEQQLWTAKFVNRTTGVRSTASWRVIFQYLMATEMAVVMVGVLCAIMAVVLIGFFGYHCYLTAQNLTTNETFKWNYIIELYYRWVKSHPLAKKEWLELQKLPKLTEEQQKQKVALETALATPPPKQPPVNMYNRGIWENVREVIWPLHERPASALPAHAGLLAGGPKPVASEPAKQSNKSRRKRK